MLPLAALILAPDATLRGIAARNVEAFRRAMLRKDVPWFERTFARTYAQRVEDEAAIDRTTALAQLRKGLLRANITSLTTKILAVRSEGHDYTVTIAFAGTLPATLQNRKSRLLATWRDEQRWTPANGRWLLQATHTSRFERTIDAL